MARKHKKTDFLRLSVLSPYLKRYWKSGVIMALTGILVSVIDAILPLFNRYAIDHFVKLQTLDTIVWFILLYIVLLCVQTLSNYMTIAHCARVELMVDRDLRNAAFAHLQQLSFGYFNQNTGGSIHARIISDTGRIGELYSWQLMDLVWNMAYLLSAFIVMFMTDVRLSLYFLALLPFAIICVAYFQRRLLHLNRAIRETNATVTGNLNEGITGIRSIKTLVVEKTLLRDFQKDTDKLYHQSISAKHHSALMSSLIALISSLALALVVWHGGNLTMAQKMQIGTLSIFMSYAIGILEPIKYMVMTFSQIIGIQVNIDRFIAFMATESEVKDRPEVVERYGDTFVPKVENWEPLHGDVTFQDVSFHYPDGAEMVLEHFNLHVPSGTSVAIVGETGAGKSTLINLVCRFYEPTEGRILIDGRDVRERSQLWLHRNIGYVLQSPHLFSGTVRDNLRYGNPEANDEEIWHALSLVRASEAVKRMGNGLDGQVGEGGDHLSMGEKQLLSFARALLANPRILILDEATSSVDTETEKVIQDAIMTVIKGRTSFVVAHRLSTIVHSDLILVVQDGKIVERGTHQELMHKRGYYYELYMQQFSAASVNLGKERKQDTAA